MIFVLILLLYGGIQFYFSAKLIHAFNLSGWSWSLTLAWAGLMTISPLLHWRLERCSDCHVLAVSSAWIVFGWMGFSFLFIWLGLALDGYGRVARLASLPVLAARPAFLFLVVLTLALWLAGFYSARHPRVERLTIYSDKIPPGPGLRIAQISDVHLGIMTGKQRLDRLLEQIRQLQPDILVSTGDLVDAEAHYVDGLSSRLAAYQPRYGKFAVTGNHERYAGLEHALDFHARSGFKLLRRETADVTGAVTLAGIDDPAVHVSKTGEARMLAAIPSERFVVLLKHQPVIDPQSRFDLQLSGHTHNGQIFPFNLVVKTVYPLIKGRHDLPNGSRLYVSRGTGTWGPPIRILSPPEITLIELKRP
jgi:predicted MPP superfamily phosphohydrolase